MKVFYILYFTIISFVYGNTSAFIKRQGTAIASQQCANKDQTWSICSPAEGDTWYNGTYQQLTWKYNHPVFNNFTILSFYILQKLDTEYKTIKKINVEHALGVQVELIDDSWYSSQLPPNSANVSVPVYAYLIGDSTNLQEELANTQSFFPKPISFTLIENAHNTTSSTSSTSSPTNGATTNANDSSSPQSSSFPGWAIAVIVIVALLIIAAALALFWLLRKIRKNRQQQSGALILPDNDPSNANNALLSSNSNNNLSNHHLSQDNLNSNNNSTSMTMATSSNTIKNKGIVNQVQQIETRDMSSSIHSSTPMMQQPINRGNGGSGSPTAPSPTSVERSPSIATNMTSTTNTTSPTHILHHGNDHHHHPQQNPILSSTDAIRIADTFRQLMRKPDWNEHSNEEINSESSLLKESTSNDALQQQKKLDDVYSNNDSR